MLLIDDTCNNDNDDDCDDDNNKDMLQSDVKHCGLASKLPSDFRVVILLQNRALKMKIMIMLTKVTKITCVLTSESRYCFNDDKNGNDNDEDDDDDDDDDAKRD